MQFLEVAQITSDAETGDRVVRYKLKGKKGETKTIDATSPLMEPLCYPILFNRGEQGWGVNMKKEEHIEFQSYLACRLLRPEPTLLLDEGPEHHRMPRYVNRFQVFSRLGKLSGVLFYTKSYLYKTLPICRTNLFR
jgi:hypothetical protein